MKRDIITIDEEKCTGCGLCIPGCPEGALQVIDGKARLVSDLMCDGLGACIGECPEGAISVEQREAVPYDEYAVMEHVVPQGENTIKAHLKHLKDHGQDEFHAQAVDYLNKQGIPVPEDQEAAGCKNMFSACPGSKTVSFSGSESTDIGEGREHASGLTHWPVQLHLLSPSSPHYRDSDLLLAADCTAFSTGLFHSTFLKGKTLAIACPKLDDGQEVYLEKLQALIDTARINTLTVLIMEVPCCGGLVRLAQTALQRATRRIPVKVIVVGIKGDIIRDEWL
ncbi:4Fe-4S binding protein [bacterium]|nr:4Fe-4S binding protein [bacterium]